MKKAPIKKALVKKAPIKRALVKKAPIKRKTRKKRKPRRKALTIGSKLQVFRGSRDKTVSGLRKGDFMRLKRRRVKGKLIKGRLVSKRKHNVMIKLIKSGNHPFLTKTGRPRTRRSALKLGEIIY